MWLQRLLLLGLLSVGHACCPPEDVLSLTDDYGIEPIGGTDADNLAFLLQGFPVSTPNNAGFAITPEKTDCKFLLQSFSVGFIKFQTATLRFLGENDALLFSSQCLAEHEEDTQFVTTCTEVFGPCLEVMRIEVTITNERLETLAVGLAVTGCCCEREPILSLWEEFGPCSESCGDGTQTRIRTCTPDEECPNCDGTGDCDCGEVLTETEECSTPLDPPVLTQWSTFGPCNVTCDEGTKTRTRDCIPDGDCPDCETDACVCGTEPLVDTGTCSIPLDPPVLTTWSNFGPCNVTCGEGTKTRTRDCIPDGDCPDCETDACDCGNEPLVDTGTCSIPLDPPVLSIWGDWGPCDVTCGDGTRMRTRTCDPDGPCPNCEHVPCDCGEPLEDTGDCSFSYTPAVWGTWAPWLACSVTCGIGTKRRKRRCWPDGECPDCKRPINCVCIGDKWEEMECGTPREDPYWTPWGPWSACDAECKCGEGSSTRDRRCRVPSCPTAHECTGDGWDTRNCFIPIECIDYNNYLEFGTIIIENIFTGNPAKVLAGSGIGDPEAEVMLLVRYWDEQDYIKFNFLTPVSVYSIAIQTFVASKVTVDYMPTGITDQDTIPIDLGNLNLVTSNFNQCIEDVHMLNISFVAPTVEMIANELTICVCLPEH